MGDKTGISWTDATWNPVRGCSRVSEGCRHCYAERVAGRFSGPGQPYDGLARHKLTIINADEHDPGNRSEARWTGEVRFVAEHLADPLRWKRPRRIFVNSMSDLFHERLTNEQIAAVFGVMASAPRHTFQILTKRARRMREWFEWFSRTVSDEAEPDPGESLSDARSAERLYMLCHHAANEIGDGSDTDQQRQFDRLLDLASDVPHRLDWPLPNVWLGVSVENQEAADERIPDLLATPAAVRFLSCEPLIGPVRLDDIGNGWSALAKTFASTMTGRDGRVGIDWVIAGCESGPGARPADVAWFRGLRDQCKAAGVAYFLKQAAPAQGTLAHDDPKPAPIGIGKGAKWKQGAVIELPYLDGVQHAAFPETAP